MVFTMYSCIPFAVFPYFPVWVRRLLSYLQMPRASCSHLGQGDASSLACGCVKQVADASTDHRPGMAPKGLSRADLQITACPAILQKSKYNGLHSVSFDTGFKGCPAPINMLVSMSLAMLEYPARQDYYAIAANRAPPMDPTSDK